jgi:ubiquinone/menaquinone biosynthesis C-methylase UbiE
MDDKESEQLEEIRSFYDSVYYKSDKPDVTVSNHLRRLAKKTGIQKDQQVLDVACGAGNWLLACSKLGASTSGVDLSEKAISICNSILPQGEFYSTPAESLPFEDNKFDVVSCLGSLEHFVDPGKALNDMVRVAKDDATFILLVPNADFLTRRIGLFSGTYQVDAKEHVRTLEEWNSLFNDAGLAVTKRWKDLHVLSWSWISSGPWYSIPIRTVQALALTVWPLKWQYQVYHQCRAGKR